MKIKNTSINHIHKKFLGCLYYWEKYPAIASMVIFFGFLGILCLTTVYNFGDAPMDDHYFNFKVASLIASEGLSAIEEFNWPYLNVVNHDITGRYQINLYHIIAIPFTFIKDNMVGLKLFDIFIASSFFTLIYYTLRKLHVSYPLFFTLFLFASHSFLMRILLGRAFIWTTALVLFEVYLAINKKYKFLLLVILFHVIWHQASFFIPIVAIASVESARYLYEKIIYFKNIIFALLGMFIGMVIYSNFPNNIIQLILNIFSVQSASNNFEKIEGGELIKKDFVYDLLLQNTFFFFITVISIGIAIFLYVKLKNNKKLFVHTKKITAIYSYSIFLLAVIFGSLVISGRFFDYVLPTAVVTFALIVTFCRDEKIIFIRSDFQNFFKKILYVFVILLCLGSLIMIKIKYASFNQNKFEKIAQWIDVRSDKGERVFLESWGYFVLMFFYNSDNTYSMGMEPNDARKSNPDLYWKWYNFSNNVFFCEKQKDCRDDASIFFGAINELDDEDIKKYNKENSRKIINSILYEFESEFIVSDNKDLNQVLHYNEDMIEDSFQARSNDGRILLEVFQLKKTNE